MTGERIGIVKRALSDAVHCGDECAAIEHDGMLLLCIVDGLGHGHAAEVAAHAAVDAFRHDFCGGQHDLLALLERCDLAIRHTRGAVAGLALIDGDNGSLRYAAVGNPRAVIWHRGEKTRHLPSTPGIVGAGFHPPRIEHLALAPGDLLVLYTDGFPTSLGLTAEPHRADALPPDELASWLLQNKAKGTDDAGLLVYRHR